MDNLEQPLVNGAGLTADVEFVCRNDIRYGTRFLMACLVAKLTNPAIDIRKPSTKMGGRGSYSGRDYDQKHIADFVRTHRLPVNKTTGFLTPALRTKTAIIKPGVKLGGRSKELDDKIVYLITAVHENKVAPDLLLAEILRWLVVLREERKQRMETLSASLKAVRSDTSLPAEQIVTLIQQHLALPRSSRLPVLVVAAAYRAAQELLRERLLPLHSHTAADSQTGALGDVQIALRDEQEVVTVYEMKAKRVTREDVEIAARKVVIAGRSVDNYIFVTTEAIDEEVKDFAGTLHARIGVEFAILDCVGFLRHFLHLFYRVRMVFLEAYQELLLSEPDSAVSAALKEAFLTLRLATETGVAQASEDQSYI